MRGKNTQKEAEALGYKTEMNKNECKETKAL